MIMINPVKLTAEFYARIDEETKGTDRHFVLSGDPLIRLMYTGNEAVEIRDQWLRLNTGHPRNRERDDGILDEVGDTALMLCSYAITNVRPEWMYINGTLKAGYNIEKICEIIYLIEKALDKAIGSYTNYSDTHESELLVASAWAILTSMFGLDTTIASMMLRMRKLTQKNNAPKTFAWIESIIDSTNALTLYQEQNDGIQ